MIKKATKREKGAMIVQDYSVSWNQVKPLLEKELARRGIGDDDKVAFADFEMALRRAWDTLFEEMYINYARQ